ncbi:MAG: hypothetical protein WDN48_11415 [Pseudolabrys sp.]
MRLLSVFAAVLLLSGCAHSGGSGGGMNSVFGGTGAPAKPRAVIVSDFVLAQEVAVIDRGFADRQEKQPGNWPILERRQRAAARVNDEIVATVVTTLRDAGLAAQPGNQDAASGDALLLSGRLKIAETRKSVPLERLGIGHGRSGVVADMTLKRQGGFGSTPLLTFTADGNVGNRKPPTAADAKARNEEISGVLAAVNAVPEKLSPDVEAQARNLGRSIAEKVLGYAGEQGWLVKPDIAEAAPAPSEKPVRVAAPKPDKPKPENKPEAKPDKKPEKKPAKPAASDGDTDSPSGD